MEEKSIDKKELQISDFEQKEQKDFYEKMRYKIETWLKENGLENKYAGYLLLAPDFFYLLIKLIKDDRVPRKEKVKLAAVIAYFISPIDLIPEAILGPIGFVDDVALAAFVLNGLLNRVDEKVVKENWPGEGDILEEIQKIIEKADDLIGSGLIKKIKKYIDGI
ncbi:MAG: DUF1232 domain-containing protein [Calditrichia bacterium]|nr:DUF1232 domain-containing protein [Calditrichia bacterium]